MAGADSQLLPRCPRPAVWERAAITWPWGIASAWFFISVLVDSHCSTHSMLDGFISYCTYVCGNGGFCRAAALHAQSVLRQQFFSTVRPLYQADIVSVQIVLKTDVERLRGTFEAVEVEVEHVAPVGRMAVIVGYGETRRIGIGMPVSAENFYETADERRFSGAHLAVESHRGASAVFHRGLH